ncbi:YesL family protein [Alkalihalobacillus pseudalcaliphilus]|uniref:YesL family protein n=1 Tax=Alkalihalobacillus pseudalcaliphilus TaxID=79884 RepID=UPI00064DA25C|nr:YesL family protein [Alkalihalobacillus pseudalcaliphilus]KMK75560.1 hypothetical protein AB990_09710 [Alkalihalobacillus pseudalcaliphilus]
MQVSWMSSRFYLTCEWIWRFGYLHLLWLLFTLAGLIIFGLTPATVAVFAVVRKWRMKDADASVFTTFFHTYKKEFVKSNGIGLIMLIVAAVIIFNYFMIRTMPGLGADLLFVGNSLIAIFFVVVSLFIFPVYVHYQLSFLKLFRTALVIGLMNPHFVFLTLLIIAFVGYGFYLLPGLIPFFSSSVLAMCVMWFALNAFNHVEKKQRKWQEEESIGN